MRDDIVLIGPPRVGKTTLARRLASHLGQAHHEFDALRRGYYEEVGFDMALNLRLFEEQGWPTMYQYWKVFDPHALERFFADGTGVLDVGGGTPVAEHPAVVERIAQAFRPFRHVVLLMPDPDLETSLALLATRGDDAATLAPNQRYLMAQGSLQRLATHTVFTGARDPAAVFEEVLARVGG